MKFSTLITHSAQALKILIKSSLPSDLLLSDYFKQKKYIGSKERKFISETVFNCLRKYSLVHKSHFMAFTNSFNFTPQTTNLEFEKLITYIFEIIVSLLIIDNRQKNQI